MKTTCNWHLEHYTWCALCLYVSNWIVKIHVYVEMFFSKRLSSLNHCFEIDKLKVVLTYSLNAIMVNIFFFALRSLHSMTDQKKNILIFFSLACPIFFSKKSEEQDINLVWPKVWKKLPLWWIICKKIERFWYILKEYLLKSAYYVECV